MSQQQLNRRQFTRRVTLVFAGGGLLSALRTDDAEAQVQLTIDLADPRYEALHKVGGAIRVVPQGSFDPVIVVRLSEEEFVAYSSTCPHRGCTVDLPDEDGIVLCPCHDSTFDQRGRYIAGPANVDLPPVELQVDGATAVWPSTWSRIKKTR
ncbi:MAG: Rieske (2Fe-2S) protein [bacterium]|nr:Rieske (2Fe-2S) protein [bacterium]